MGDHLIILCCHAVYAPRTTEGHEPSDPFEEDNWLLQDFQKSIDSKRGEHEAFIGHALAAVQTLSTIRLTAMTKRLPGPIAESGGAAKEEDRKDHGQVKLVISGGRTKPGRCSESASYLRLMKEENMLASERHSDIRLEDHIILEEYATDSYQNLLFSILRYHAETGSWPAMITVITHAFKTERFLHNHAGAIRWPLDRICVQGINPPFMADEFKFVTEKDLHTRALFQKDPSGAKPPLSDKRKERLWNEKCLELDILAKLVLPKSELKQLQALLHWTGNGIKSQYPGDLPWTTNLYTLAGAAALTKC